MMSAHPQHKGFVFIYVMIIVASILVAVAIVGGQTGVFFANNVKEHQASAEAAMVAEYCGENLLMQVRNNTALTSSGSLTFAGGTCTYSVTGTSPNKTITLSVVKNNIYRRTTITTTQVSPTILVTWVETN